MSNHDRERMDVGNELWHMAGFAAAVVVIVLFVRFHSQFIAINNRVTAFYAAVTSVGAAAVEHPSPASLLGAVLGLVGGLLHMRLVRAAVVLAAVLTGVRVYATRRTLLTREARVVIPPDDFEPSAEAIAAFGHQLLGVRRHLPIY